MLGHLRGRGNPDFYPRPPRGGRLFPPLCTFIELPISTHALREEGDSILCAYFYSYRISTHALREEGDQVFFSVKVYPGIFLPTPSARRATL